MRCPSLEFRFAATRRYRAHGTVTLRQRAKKRPSFPGRFRFSQYQPKSLAASGGDLAAVDDLRGLRAGGDRNVPRLLGFGNLADEVDVEQAVLERGVLHLDEIGKLEYALEGARGDAAVQHFGFVLAVL